MKVRIVLGAALALGMTAAMPAVAQDMAGGSGQMGNSMMGNSMAPMAGMSKSQMMQMKKCQAMSSDMMMKNKKCAAMAKMHPEMMSGGSTPM